MPELPEVETIRRGLLKRIIGKKIVDFTSDTPKQLIGDPKEIIEAKIQDIRRFSKILVLDFDNAYSVLIHLKLTGQLVYDDKEGRIAGGHPIPPLNTPIPNSTTHHTFIFEDGSKLYFNDLRKFGYLKIVKTSEVSEQKAIAEFGPEPLSDVFTLERFREILNRWPNRLIKVLLLDQTSIAGLGNIYSDEALARAGIKPQRKVGTLSEEEVKKLYHSIIEVLEEGIKYGGSSDATYVNAEGGLGTFLDHALVYHKKKCFKCNEPIQRIKIGGRTSHYCECMQK